MKRAIIITEECEEGVDTMVCDYDLLPKKVKDRVDTALLDDNLGVEIDIYESGLQSLDDAIDYQIYPNSEVVYMGQVTFYHD